MITGSDLRHYQAQNLPISPRNSVTDDDHEPHFSLPGALGEEALERAETVEADGLVVRILGAEYLAAIALATGRAKDKARLLMFLEHPGFGRSGFEAVVHRHGLGNAWARFVRELQVEP